jgi:beta-lactamase regulating signal transducer with metallopeptidase domain
MTVALLIEMAWKSGLIAALALAGAALLRGRPAAERVVFLRLAMLVVFALPVLAAVAPALRIEAPAPAPRVEAAGVPLPAVAPTGTTPARPVAAPAAGESVIPPLRPRPSILQIVAGVYAFGVAALLLRLLSGVIGLALWTRRAEPVSDRRWLAALDRAAGTGSRPALRASTRIRSPLSWGWRPAVILINVDALGRPDRADAVLTHEMGHVRHADWVFLMLSRALVALLWFNPLVWLLQRELSRQSEQAADAWAVRRIDRADYAGVLVAMARGARPQTAPFQAAVGMAGPGRELARRVAAVLSSPPRQGRPWPTVMAATACIVLATPLAALDLARATPGPSRLELRPMPTGPTSAPTLTATATAGAVSAAFVAAPRTPHDEPLTPDQQAAVIRQRALGLAMMEAGLQKMDAAALLMRQQAETLPMDADDRADLLRDAAGLEADAEELRAEARELAARDLSTLQPMSAEEEREMQAELEEIRAIPLPMEIALQTAVGVRVEAPRDSGPPDARSGDLPEAARRRRDAEEMDRHADRLSGEAAAAPSARQAAELNREATGARAQAASLRQQAADLERHAMNGPPPPT